MSIPLDIEISGLNPIPPSWSLEQVEDFIKNRCLIPCADPNVDTYGVSYAEFLQYVLSDISGSTQSLVSLTNKVSNILNGVSSILYVNKDSGVNDEEHGRTQTTPYAELSYAVSSLEGSSNSLIIVDGLNSYTQVLNSTNLPNNTTILCRSNNVALSFSGVSFGIDVNISCNKNITVNDNAFSGTAGFCSKESVYITGAVIPSGNANLYVRSKAFFYDSNATMVMDVLSKDITLSGNAGLDNSTLNANNLYIGSDNTSVTISGENHITANKIEIQYAFSSPAAFIIADGKLYLKVDMLLSNATSVWAAVAYSPASNRLAGFIGEVSGNTSIVGDDSKVKITYGGTKSGVYDAVCYTDNELATAIASSTVKTIYLINALTASGTLGNDKKFYGNYINWGISTNRSVYFYNTCVVTANVSFNEVYFTLVTAAVSRTLTINTSCYYERKENIVFSGNTVQNYWITRVANASTSEMGVVKIHPEDFDVDQDGFLVLKNKNANHRYLDGSIQSSNSYYLGQGSISTNYGTDDITVNNDTILVKSTIKFLQLTLSIKSTFSLPHEVTEWIENVIEIGNWVGSNFVVVKSFSFDHLTDNVSINDSVSFVIDSSVFGSLDGNGFRHLGIKFSCPSTLSYSLYVSSLVQLR